MLIESEERERLERGERCTHEMRPSRRHLAPSPLSQGRRGSTPGQALQGRSEEVEEEVLGRLIEEVGKQLSTASQAPGSEPQPGRGEGARGQGRGHLAASPLSQGRRGPAPDQSLKDWSEEVRGRLIEEVVLQGQPQDTPHVSF
jgi:hypothetical protein